MARISARSGAQLNQPTMRPCASWSDWISRPLSARGIGPKAQILQAAAPLDQAQLAIVEMTNIAEHRVQFVERRAQRRVPLDREAPIVGLRHRETDDGEGDHRRGQQHQRQ